MARADQAWEPPPVALILQRICIAAGTVQDEHQASITDMSKTAPPLSRGRWTALRDAKHLARLAAANIILRAQRRIERLKALAETYETCFTDYEKPRLTQAEVARFTQQSEIRLWDAINLPGESQLFKSTAKRIASSCDNGNPADRYAAAILDFESLLREEPGRISSVVNLGCWVDVILYNLAHRHANTTFESWDFSSLTRDFIKTHLSLSDNWRFRFGYPLEMLEAHPGGIDAVIVSGVLSLVPYGELHAYLKALAGRTRFVLITDLWGRPAKSLRLGRYPAPRDIPTTKPLVFCSQNGGRYLHNYLDGLEQHGFSIRRWSIRPDSSGTNTISILAEYPESASGEAPHAR